MRYRRNVDVSLRNLERQVEDDPSLGLRFYQARRRAGRLLEFIDYQVLANFELAGGEIPYEIDLELNFPYGLARTVFIQKPSIQAYYRVIKVQQEAVEASSIAWLTERGVEWDVDPIPPELRRPFRDFQRRLRVSLTDNQLADFWVKDIESRLHRKRELLGTGIYTNARKLVHGLIQEQTEKPEIVALEYDFANAMPQKLLNGALFSLRYGKNCCYDTSNYLGGSVWIQVFGSNPSAWRYVINFSLIEYGRHYSEILPLHLLRGRLHYNTGGIISGAHPAERIPSDEERQRYDIPANISLFHVVNGAHLFDILRDHYYEYLPRFKEIFEEGHVNQNLNQNLIESPYYHPYYSHAWQINEIIRDRIGLLDILGIPHAGGKIPKDASGTFYFQQYKFILYPSRGKQGKLMRLYVVCPVTGREIPVGRWTQYYPTLLKLERPEIH